MASFFARKRSRLVLGHYYLRPLVSSSLEHGMAFFALMSVVGLWEIVGQWDEAMLVALGHGSKGEKGKMKKASVESYRNIPEVTDSSQQMQGSSVQTTDTNGTAHSFTFDKKGRLIEDRITALGGAVRRIAWSYNNRGLLAKASSYADNSSTPLNEVAFTYNAFNQLVEDAQSHGGEAGAGTPKVAYSYANGGSNTIRRQSVTYPGGKILLLGYGDVGLVDDRLSRLSAVTVVGESNALCMFQWMGLARLVRLQMPIPDVELTYEKIASEPVGDGGDPYIGYDRFGRTVDMRWQLGATAASVSRINMAMTAPRAGCGGWTPRRPFRPTDCGVMMGWDKSPRASKARWIPLTASSSAPPRRRRILLTIPSATGAITRA